MQLPNSVSQPPAQPPLGDGVSSLGRPSGTTGPSQNLKDLDSEPAPKKKKRDKAIDFKRQWRFLIDSESLWPQKLDYGAILSARPSGPNVEQTW